MSQQAAVTLNTVVYSPDGSKNGLVVWTDRSGGVANSFSLLTQSFETGVGGLKLTQASYKLRVPIVATASDACSCAGSVLRESSAQLTFKLDPASTLAERTDLFLRIKDLAASTLLSGTVNNLNPAYA